MIQQTTIHKIKEAIDIIDVVSEFVTLKKKGSSWQCCCPFHNEKTPSFSVSETKGIYHCFGCHKSGDAIDFVMSIEKYTYPEALRYLAKKYHLEIEEVKKTEQTSPKENILTVLRFAKDYYKNNMLNDSQAIALQYLQERSINESSLKKFELGYSKNEWQGLENFAIKNHFTKDILSKAGLSIQKDDGKTYDTFRGRLMFPIHNLVGDVVGFGARALQKNENPKYINSVETEIYHKGDILYGLYQAKKAIRTENECILTEGYTDVISLCQNGVENVVASLGTSLTEKQIALIKRFTNNLVLLYDGDVAGRKAVLKSIDTALEQGLNIKICELPTNQDPDSYVREVGKEAFKTYILENCKDFVSFKFDFFKEEINDNDKKSEFIKTLIESCSKISDLIKKSLYLSKIGNLLNISDSILVRYINNIESNKKVIEVKQNQNTYSILELLQSKNDTEMETDKTNLVVEVKPKTTQDYITETLANPLLLEKVEYVTEFYLLAEKEGVIKLSVSQKKASFAKWSLLYEKEMAIYICRYDELLKILQ